MSISDVYIYFLVNSAIIYMDMERFDVALNKVNQALKLCGENDKMYYFVLDEKSRLFERMEENSKALNALLKVERYYVSVKKDVKK